MSVDFSSFSLTQLLERRSQLDAEIAIKTGGAVAGTTLKKERKPSKNKGLPTAYGAFSSKIQAEHKDEITAFKAANPDKKRGAHFEWVGNYKKAHEDEYKTFEAAFKAEHPKDETASEAGASETSSEKRRGPKKLDEMNAEERAEHDAKIAKRKAEREAMTPEQKAAKKAAAAEKKAKKEAVPAADAPADAAVAAPAAPATPKPKKATKKATKASEPVVPVAVAPATFSATTTVVAAPAPAVEDDAPEFLPFKHGGITYMRLGTKREGGNLWATGDLWANKKGVKGQYVGCLEEDGSIDTDADEPTIE